MIIGIAINTIVFYTIDKLKIDLYIIKLFIANKAARNALCFQLICIGPFILHYFNNVKIFINRLDGNDKPGIEITDVLGRQLDFEWIKDNQINLSKIESGFIFIKIKTDEGISVKKVFVKL